MSPLVGGVFIIKEEGCLYVAECERNAFSATAAPCLFNFRNQNMKEKSAQMQCLHVIDSKAICFNLIRHVHVSLWILKIIVMHSIACILTVKSNSLMNSKKSVVAINIVHLLGSEDSTSFLTPLE